MTKALLGYLRVSGKGQVEGDGPERQQLAIEAFAKRHKLPLLRCVLEPGVSGTTNALERPVFGKLLDVCLNGAQGPGVAIVVERMDRLARDLLVQELLLAECRRTGVAIYSADTGELLDVASCDGDPARKAFRQMAGIFAEWDKTSTVLKLRAARKRHRDRTGRCEGRKPYGANECEKAVLAIMLSRWAMYHSYKDVAEWLNASGTVTRMGKPWNRGTVWAIMNRNAGEGGPQPSESDGANLIPGETDE